MRVVSRVCAVAVVASLSACVQATNPFDPETPADQQAPGRVVGRVFLTGVDLNSIDVELQLKDAAGNAVTIGGAAGVIVTRHDDDGFPDGLQDDGLGAAGTFEACSGRVGGGDGNLDVLRTGELDRLQVIADVSPPIGGEHAVLMRDSYFQPGGNFGAFGFAEEAVVHFGVDRIVTDGSNGFVDRGTSAGEGDVVSITNENNIVFFSAPDTTTGGLTLMNTIVAPNVVPPSTGVSEAVAIAQGQIRWPYFITLVRPTTTRREAFLQVYNLNSGALVSSQFIANVTDQLFNGLSSSVAIYGGQAFVALTTGVFGAGGTDVDQGIYRLSFNTVTGVLGAPAKVENGSTTALHLYGRRLYYTRNNGAGLSGVRGLRVQTLASPTSWPATTLLTSDYLFEHAPAFSGPFVVAPSDTDGTRFYKLGFNAVTAMPNTITTIDRFDVGADSQAAFMVGNRIFALHRGSSVFILKAR